MTFESFIWRENYTCRNPLTYEWIMGRMRACVEVAQHLGRWYYGAHASTSVAHLSSRDCACNGADVVGFPTRAEAIAAGLAYCLEFFKSPGVKASRLQVLRDAYTHTGGFDFDRHLPTPIQDIMNVETEQIIETTEKRGNGETDNHGPSQPIELMADRFLASGGIGMGTLEPDVVQRRAEAGARVDEYLAGKTKINMDAQDIQDGKEDPSTPAPINQYDLAVAEPEELFPVAKADFSKTNVLSTGGKQLSCHDIKKAIHDELDQEVYYRRQSAIHDLRAGVLFHIYRMSLGIGNTGFWSECEVEFKIGRSTVSKKMRLAAIWAKEAGASSEVLMQLAEAADLNDKDHPAVQLAFDFIGTNTITDLYRKYKLVSNGPRGGVVTPVDPETGRLQRAARRTKAEIERMEFEIGAKAWIERMLDAGEKALSMEFDGARVWDLATDDQLESLRGYAQDIQAGIVASQGRRREARGRKGERAKGRGNNHG